MWQQLPMAPADPILGLMEAVQRDPRPEKLNLGVGVYQDESGITPVLSAVKEAERRLVELETSKSYLGIAGLDRFVRQCEQLVWGERLLEGPLAGRIVTVQTPGGTAALRVAIDLLRTHFPASRVWLSDPTWANHPGICRGGGVQTATYAYYEPASRGLDFSRMLEDLQGASPNDVVLLHGCCHNPTGVDLSAAQWRELADLLKRRQLLPLVDFAYQGFGRGLREDTEGLEILAETLDELLVASSYSKNFGLYSERVGALSAVAADKGTAATVLSQIKQTIRVNYSNPPAHGAAIVAQILEDAQLRAGWEAELAQMRGRIHRMRSLLAEGLSRRMPERDFSFITRQNGMFSFSGLAPHEVDRLRDEFAVYMVRSGRINVAGITSGNVDRLCDAIAAVLATD